MQYTLPIASFLMVVLVASYYFPQFADAQMSNREICDAETCHVKITKDGFVPKTLIVKIGTTVVWTNIDDGRHTVTSGSPGEVKAPLKSLLLAKSDTYEFTLHHGGLYKGTYKYFDQVTKSMRGEIIVEPAPEGTEERVTETQTIKIDFQDPESGVKKFTLSNGSIKSMKIDPDSRSLIITIEAMQSNGNLEITLDRNLIDSKTDGKDDHFLVLVDEVEGSYGEISSTSTERTLQIAVPVDTTEIEIFGTQVVPEFPVAMLVIAGIFTTMIAAYRLRTRF